MKRSSRISVRNSPNLHDGQVVGSFCKSDHNLKVESVRKVNIKFILKEESMTSNQIELRKAQESERANRTKEKETERHNRADVQKGYRTAATKNLTDLATSATKLFNHPEWYSLDPQLVQDTANISYVTRFGLKLADPSGKSRLTYSSMYRINYTHVLPHDGTVDLPDIAGVSNAIRTAAQNIFAWVRHENSGARNYEATDLMMYILSVIGVYTEIAELTRVYKAAVTFSNVNAVYGDRLVTMLGYDPVDVRQNLALVRAGINRLIVRIESLNVPSTMPLLQRWLWLNLNVFKDKDLPRSAVYAFVQQSVMRYNFADVTIDYTNLITRSNIMQRISEIDSVINSILNIEDIGVMSGDILKAYTAEQLIRFPSLMSDNDSLTPVFSEQTNTQVRMGVMVGNFNPNTITISQDGPLFKQLLVSQTNGSTTLQNSELQQMSVRHNYVEAYTAAPPKPEETITSTRLACTYYVRLNDANTAFMRQVISCGTEVMNGIDIWGGLDESEFSPIPTRSYQGGQVLVLQGPNTSPILADVMPVYSDWLSFAKSLESLPTMGFIYLPFTNVPSIPLYIPTPREVNNWALVDEQVLLNMHNTAVISLFGIPLVGSKRRSVR